MKLSLAQKKYDSKRIGKWEGLNDIQRTYLHGYIEKKYGKDLHYLPFINYKLNFVDDKPALTTLDFFDFTTDHLGLRFDKNDSMIEIKPYFDRYIYTRKRFTYFPLSIYKFNNVKDLNYNGRIKPEWAHEMTVIYDKKINEIEIFDNSGIPSEFYKTILKKFFKNIYGNAKIVYMKQCKYIGEHEVYKCDGIEFDFKSEGFCVVWSMWYLEFRLKNKQFTRKEILDFALHRLSLGNFICKFIRSYAQFIQDIDSEYTVIKDKNRVILEIKKKNQNIFKSLYLLGLLPLIAGGYYTVKKLNNNNVFLKKSK